MYFIGLGFSILIGAVLGSFAVAQVWRIRAVQLKLDLESGEKVDQAEWKKLKPLLGKKARRDRSQCLNCGYQLKWFDLIPVISWLSLGGRCRKCRKKIGLTEFLAEVGLAIIFGLLFVVNFNQNSIYDVSMIRVFRFGLLLIAFVLMLILFVYDAKWSLLPTKTVYWLIAVSVIYWALGFFEAGIDKIDFVSAAINLIISMAIFPVVYLILSRISDGQWVGDGDWLLAAGLIFLLPNRPIYAAIAMFLSNFYGILAVIGLSVMKKQKFQRGVKIPFGPMMILAALTIVIFERFFLNLITFLL